MEFLSKIFRFAGGVSVKGCKEATENVPLVRLPRPALVTVSMSQHIGAPSVPCVKPGDRVKRYQRIGDAAGVVSSAVHTPFSGVVRAIGPSATASTRVADAITIAVDPEDVETDTSLAPMDWAASQPADIVARVREAGVVGAGGAGFPTPVKLSPPPGKKIDTVIINGAECEPYLNGDNRLMVERPVEVWTGAKIIMRAVGASRAIVAIEDNKPAAIEAMRKAIGDEDGAIAVLPHSYPQGSEKHVVYTVTGRVVGTGRLPADVGCLVENIWTTVTICHAVRDGIPSVIRTVTVAGSVVARPSNFAAPIGASVADLVAAAGGFVRQPAKAICGGPMMGFAMPSLDVPITKTCSGLVFLAPEEVFEFSSSPCIGCGRCLRACPLSLQPAEIAQASAAGDIPLAERLHAMNCFECGSCAFVCPAHRPLVQHMRRVKAAIAARRRAAAAGGKGGAR